MVYLTFTALLHFKSMMDPIAAPLTALQGTNTVAPQKPSQTSSLGTADQEALKGAAADFEAAFIAQMLTHSGLADALTSGEGKMASAFGSFFVEELATEMAAMGGIGLADSIYKQLERYEAGEKG